jgi:hypothetical protein
VCANALRLEPCRSGRHPGHAPVRPWRRVLPMSPEELLEARCWSPARPGLPQRRANAIAVACCQISLKRRAPPLDSRKAH